MKGALFRIFHTCLAGAVILMAIGIMSATEARSEISIIVHPSVMASDLDKEGIKSIFLGKKDIWDNGKAIRFVLLNQENIHKEFVEQYIQRSTTQFRNYWRKMLFIGNGALPKTFKTEAELINFISSTEGAIGYISASTSAQGVTRVNVK